MRFLNPTMLMLLGLIPVLVLIHILRPKPRPVEVANLFLWQIVRQERAGQVRFRRLKKNLPLLLQILIILFSVAALAEPVMTVLARPQGHILLVIDTSASMKTRTASGTRFDVAVERALHILDRRKPHQKTLIIEAGPRPNLLAGFLENTDQAKSLINALAPTDTPADLKKAVSLAVSFLDPLRHDTIYLITDGAGTDIWALSAQHPKIVPVIVSGGRRNIGITRFAFRKAPDKQETVEIFLEIENFYPLPVSCPVRISIGRTVILDTRVSIGGEEKKQIVVPCSGVMTGIAEAVIDVEDDFDIDNRAWAVLRAAEDIWVLLVSEGNFFLEKLLAAYPNVRVNTIREIIPSFWTEQTRRHDIVIVDRMDFPPVERGNFILIDAFSPSLPAVKTGRVASPKVLDWDPQSPLMADIDLTGLVVAHAAEIRAATALTPVLEASETGLIYAYEKDLFRSVLLTFDIGRSDLPLRVAFPVLFGNIINWLTPHRLGFTNRNTKAGESIDLYVAPETDRLLIRPPGGKWKTHPVRSNPLGYSDTTSVGIYTLRERSRQRHFAVNLLDESESDIRSPVIDSDADTRSGGSGPEETVSGRPLWPLCILSALVVLMIEGFVWLRRG